MPNLRSIPIDITDPEMAKVFAGLATYNTGTITVAYKQPIMITNVLIDNQPLFIDPIGIAGSRISLMVAQAPKADPEAVKRIETMLARRRK